MCRNHSLIGSLLPKYARSWRRRTYKFVPWNTINQLTGIVLSWRRCASSSWKIYWPSLVIPAKAVSRSLTTWSESKNWSRNQRRSFKPPRPTINDKNKFHYCYFWMDFLPINCVVHVCFAMLSSSFVFEKCWFYHKFRVNSSNWTFTSAIFQSLHTIFPLIVQSEFFFEYCTTHLKQNGTP